MGFTLTAGQTIGLAFIQDIFFFHQQARKIGVWTAMFLASPYCGPLFGYFIVAKTGDWRPTYWMTFGLGCGILIAILLFADETWYRRDIPREQQPDRGDRIMRILGVWQIRHRKSYFMPVSQAYRRTIILLAKPIITPLLIY
jgi:MFS family permease